MPYIYIFKGAQMYDIYHANANIGAFHRHFCKNGV